ncbi:MAG: hypothetical protein KDC98_21130, partial [Planctomycetes bacterium]|nr:hypothetical protein [Planctomycetota bacterium]
VVLAAVLLFSVPVVHLGWHVVLGHDTPILMTKSQVSRPESTLDAVMSGRWMTEVETWLREASPVVWQLRGSWNELMFRCGIVQNPKVALGKDRWLFLAQTLRDQRRAFEREAAGRRRFFAAVRDAVRAAGAELVISLVPDKARIYPEFAFADGVIDAGKEPVYELALAELRELGIPVADVAAAMRMARAAMPDEPLYFARDTHWRPRGALSGGQATAALIESLPIASRLVARRPAELGTRSTVSSLGDLVGILGLLTCEVPSFEDRTRTHALSLLSIELAEEREFYTALLSDVGGVKIDPLVDDPATDVVLLGTSFSETNGAGALALALGRPVRAIINHGASGVASLREFQDELRQGTEARLVVWEIIERGLFEVQWSQVEY